jgi:hypothetical protein
MRARVLSLNGVVRWVWLNLLTGLIGLIGAPVTHRIRSSLDVSAPSCGEEVALFVRRWTFPLALPGRLPGWVARRA